MFIWSCKYSASFWRFADPSLAFSSLRASRAKAWRDRIGIHQKRWLPLSFDHNVLHFDFTNFAFQIDSTPQSDWLDFLWVLRIYTSKHAYLHIRIHIIFVHTLAHTSSQSSRRILLYRIRTSSKGYSTITFAPSQRQTDFDSLMVACVYMPSAISKSTLVAWQEQKTDDSHVCNRCVQRWLALPASKPIWWFMTNMTYGC